jgi:hypothetical protein
MRFFSSSVVMYLIYEPNKIFIVVLVIQRIHTYIRFIYFSVGWLIRTSHSHDQLEVENMHVARLTEEGLV